MLRVVTFVNQQKHCFYFLLENSDPIPKVDGDDSGAAPAWVTLTLLVLEMVSSQKSQLEEALRRAAAAWEAEGTRMLR